MRLVRVVAAACLVLLARPVFAQDWIEYKNLESRFAINAPGEPKAESIMWNSEYGSVFPGRVYTWDTGANRYSVTVIDYSDAEAAYAKGSHSVDFQGAIYWQIDIMASVDYASTQYRQRPGVKVTYDAFHYINLVTGHQLQLTNPNGSRTFVGLYLHDNRLYIMDATVAKGMPAPIIFQQSMEFLDADGKTVRYRTFYFNKPPESKNAPRRGAGGGPAAGAAAAPGQGNGGPAAGGTAPGGGGQVERGGGGAPAAPPATPPPAQP